MINSKALERRHAETLPQGKTVSYCRCWQSAKHPYCDGTHHQVNRETGDNVGPVAITAGPPEAELEVAEGGLTVPA